MAVSVFAAKCFGVARCDGVGGGVGGRGDGVKEVEGRRWREGRGNEGGGGRGEEVKEVGGEERE